MCSSFLVLAPELGSAQSGTSLLPDLNPVAPSGPRPTAAGGRYYLTFSVRIDNNGTGPLTLRGARGSTAEPQMSVSQIVKVSDGTTTSVPNVGVFVYDAQYGRWGFQPYQVYELRRASDFGLVATGPDMNFCVNDYTNPSPRLPGEPTSPAYGCGSGRPTLLTLDEGISVGWANGHSAGRKGQLIDLTGVPAGSYILVHRVNPNNLLTESTLANNASSVRITLSWQGTYPRVTLNRSCPETETCA